MARRLVNTTLKNEKDTFTFELWDMESVSADTDHVCEFSSEGFEIKWRGSEKDSPVMASTCSFGMYLTEAQRSVIMPVVFDGNEFQLCVRIKRGNNVFWCGMVHSEQVTEVIEDGIIQVSFSASDGLGMLSNIDWKDDAGDRYAGDQKVRDAIWTTLKRLPHISLLGNVGTAVLKEHSIIQPITGNSTNDFLFGPVASNYYGVLDHLHMNPDTFYYSNNVEEAASTTSKFGSMDRFNPDDFTESSKVLESIMTSLGATICFADGCFHVFDKTQRFMTSHDETYPILEYYVTAGNDLDTYANYTTGHTGTKYDKGALGGVVSTYSNYPNYHFARGIAKRGSHPVRGVTQKHINAGSDLMYANGIGYFDDVNTAVWETGEGFNTPLIKQYRNNKFNTPSTGDTKKYTISFKDGTDTDYTWDGLFNTRNRNRDIQDIQIPNGANEGEVRIHLSGNISYTKRELSSGAPANGPWGSLGIYKQLVEIYDGTYWYRLSRPVRTLAYDSQGNAYSNDILGSAAGVYNPKLYAGTYEWIRDDDSRYTSAWLMVPLGANNAIIEEGTTSRYLNTDYPNTQFYTPPLTKVKTGEDNDNILQKDNDRFRYVYRHDYVYEMPDASGTIERLRVRMPVLEEWAGNTGPNLLNDSNGNALDIGTNYGSPVYRTAQNATTAGVGNKPNSIQMFQLSGLEIFFGDGTLNYDQISVATPDTPQGKEIMNLQNTRLGASYINSGNSTNGRYRSTDYQNLTLKEDNLKWRRPYDHTYIKESSGEMVTSNFLDMRHRVRRTVTGELFMGYSATADNTQDQIIFPYDRLVTDKLDATSMMIVPYEISYQMTEGRQQFSGYFKPTSAEANVAATTDYDVDNSRGPDPASQNVEKPSGSETDTIAFENGGGTTTGGGGGTFGDIFPIFIKRF